MERTTEKGKKQRRTENGEEASSLPYVMYGYLVLLFVGLPLYMQHGLDRIGDAKYLFFRNGTLACGAMLLLLFLWEKVTGRLPGAAGVKPLDRAVFLYFLSAILSFLLSPYRETAFWGYTDWHMGLVSQALFCGIYFSCRFFYREHKSIWVLAGTVAGIVMLLGVLNCLGADPLGIYAGMEPAISAFHNWKQQLVCGICELHGRNFTGSNVPGEGHLAYSGRRWQFPLFCYFPDNGKSDRNFGSNGAGTVFDNSFSGQQGGTSEGVGNSVFVSTGTGFYTCWKRQERELPGYRENWKKPYFTAISGMCC